MLMKYLIFFSFVTLVSCTNSPKQSGKDVSPSSSLAFDFSAAAPATLMGDPKNWCAGSFSEAVFITAAPENSDRRLFALSNVPNRVAVDNGHLTASFMLLQSGNKVEILTSDNLPVCLSNRANFQIAPDGASFRYNNGRELHFDVYLQELPNGIQIAVDLPSGAGLGIGVARCPDCK